MKTISMKEYLKGTAKSIGIKELTNGLVMLCLLLLFVQLVVIGLKGLLVLGLLFAIYKIIKRSIAILFRRCQPQESEATNGYC
jgi:hypothetical protein